MSLIYTPNGRAREYAQLACNVYRGCDHGCSYCYAPSATQRTAAQFCIPSRRDLSGLSKEVSALKIKGVTGQVLLSFTCDPYQKLDVDAGDTRMVIQTLHAHGFGVCTLTKGGKRALRDIDLFGSGDAFATTMTLLDNQRSFEWEPGAALPQDRIDAIKKFHSAGITTWVSLEPVIDPDAAMEIIRQTHGFVDLFKVGRMNYHAMAKTIDWKKWALESIALLESLGYKRQTNPDLVVSANRTNRQYYVKNDLTQYVGNNAQPQEVKRVVAQPSLF